MINKNTTDFYIKYPEYPQNSEDALYISDPIDIIVNKIETILFTNKGEVLGDPDFGADLERYVFKTKVNDTVLRQIIEQQINKYIPELSSTSYTIDITFMQDGVKYQDMALIVINLPGTQIAAIIN